MWLFEVSGCRLGDRAGSLELDIWSFRSLSPESLSAFLVKNKLLSLSCNLYANQTQNLKKKQETSTPPMS